MSAAETQGKVTHRPTVGRVVSAKMQKSVTVSIERLVKHPAYGKFIRRTTKVMAHDEEGTCREGDTVAIVECRPISKRKAWRVVEVVQRAPVENAG
ncbi:MAG TPA: 30S ribosomal protein S17 [Gammaproteobacteria bacterium]|nr:30S ribosomal protein S17 [Gammaproteobacteria bacterium]